MSYNTNKSNEDIFNNLSAETDKKVFNGGLGLYKNKTNEVTNINININTQVFNNSSNRKKQFIPINNNNDTIDMRRIIKNDNTSNAINTFSSRQPVDMSFRDAIKYMYKRIENDNFSKYKIEKERNNEQTIKNINIDIEVNTNKNRPNIESPLNQISMAIDYNYNFNKKTLKKKGKSNLEILSKAVNIHHIKNSILKNRLAYNKKHVFVVNNNFLCVLSSKTISDYMFISLETHIIYTLPRYIFNENKFSYDRHIGDDFEVEISVDKEINEEYHKEYIRNIQKRFLSKCQIKEITYYKRGNFEINYIYNTFILNSVNALILKKKKLIN